MQKASAHARVYDDAGVRREAFTGEGAGEVLSGVRQVRGADVFRPTEGNTAGVDIARHMPASSGPAAKVLIDALKAG